MLDIPQLSMLSVGLQHKKVCSPKLISEELLSMLNENGRRFIGMNVRMPKSLEEFYLPEDQRLYKPNQG